MQINGIYFFKCLTQQICTECLLCARHSSNYGAISVRKTDKESHRISFQCWGKAALSHTGAGGKWRNQYHWPLLKILIFCLSCLIFWFIEILYQNIYHDHWIFYFLKYCIKSKYLIPLTLGLASSEKLVGLWWVLMCTAQILLMTDVLIFPSCWDYKLTGHSWVLFQRLLSAAVSLAQDYACLQTMTDPGGEVSSQSNWDQLKRLSEARWEQISQLVAKSDWKTVSQRAMGVASVLNYRTYNQKLVETGMYSHCLPPQKFSLPTAQAVVIVQGGHSYPHPFFWNQHEQIKNLK
jgi:hypothetical protein